MNAFIVEFAVRSALIASLTLAIRLLIFRASAHSRANVLALGMVGLTILPIAMTLLPRIPVTVATMRVEEVAGGPVSSVVESSPVPSPIWGWLVVAITGILMAKIVVRLLRFNRIQKQLSPATEALLGRVREMASKARSVYFSPEGEPPMTWGTVHPKIALPSEAESWIDCKFRSVVLHEDAHIRRRDWAISTGFRLINAIYWFNPLVWLMRALFEQDSERAADDWVLAQGFDPQEYAERIVEVARSLRPCGGKLPAVTMARSSRLRGRLKAILNTRTQRRPVMGWKNLALVSLIMMGAGGAAFVLPKTETVMVSELRSNPTSPIKADSTPATDDFRVDIPEVADVDYPDSQDNQLSENPRLVAHPDQTKTSVKSETASHDEARKSTALGSSGGHENIPMTHDHQADDLSFSAGHGDISRAVQESQREAQRSVEEALKEAQKATSDAQREFDEEMRHSRVEMEKVNFPNIDKAMAEASMSFAKGISKMSIDIAAKALKMSFGSEQINLKDSSTQKEQKDPKDSKDDRQPKK